MKLKLDKRNLATSYAWTIVMPDGTIQTLLSYGSREQARAFLKSGTWPKGSRVAKLMTIYAVK